MKYSCCRYKKHVDAAVDAAMNTNFAVNVVVVEDAVYRAIHTLEFVDVEIDVYWVDFKLVHLDVVFVGKVMIANTFGRGWCALG